MAEQNEHIDEEIWFSAVDEQELARFDKDAAYALFRQRVAESEHTLSKRHGGLLRWLSYAAALVLLVGVSYLTYRIGANKSQLAMSETVVEAPQGSRTLVTLSDGSKVWLNAESKITYSQQFGAQERVVTLSGEGYFEVMHSDDLPFIVKSGSLEVKVLGTKFNFCDYSSDEESVVTLREGSVSLQDIRNPETVKTMRPNERAIFDKKTGQLSIEACDAEDAMAWSKGTLLFNGDMLSQIAKALERSYNVSINIADESLKSKRFYGDFQPEEQSIRDVLDALSATGKLRYRISGKVITIY